MSLRPISRISQAFTPLLAILATLTLGLFAPAAIARPTVNLAYHGGPIMSAYDTDEVVWTHESSTAAAANVEGIGEFLGDVAAASGTASAENIFSALPEYSTEGLTGGSQVAAYSSSYLGRSDVAPATGARIELPALENAIAEGVTGGDIPAPVAGPGGTPRTLYVLVMPPDMTVCAESSACGGPSDAGSLFCSLHGSAQTGGIAYAFAVILDLSGDLGGTGCGASVSQLANETANVSDQIAQNVTDPLIDEDDAWLDTNNGDVGDICTLEDQAQDKINGHTWTVQKIWSNLANNCVAGTSSFHQPTAEFTAKTATNTAELSASGTSANKLAHIPAGIVSYSWEFGDGQSATGQSVAHAYAAGGEYTVTLTATDSLGFIAHVTHAVKVTGPPATGGSTTDSPTGSNPAGASDSTTGAGTSSTVPVATPSISTSGSASTSTAGGAVVVNSGESVQCPPGGSGCTVSAQAVVPAASASAAKHGKGKGKRSKVAVGQATLTVAPGASAKITFKLNATGARLLRSRRHLIVVLTTTVRHGSAAPLVSKRTIHISLPSRPARKR